MNEKNRCDYEAQEEVTVEELKEKLKHTEQDRDKALEKAASSHIAFRAAQNTIFSLEREKERDRKLYWSKIKYYACKRMRSVKLPVFLVVLFFAFAIGVMVSMHHHLIHPTLGNLVAVAAIMVATFCAGLTYERLRR